MKAQDIKLPVYFDYYGTEGDYLVILRVPITGQYVCDIGFVRACKPSDGCTGGYHVASVCGKGYSTDQHYTTREQSAQALYELWGGKPCK